jgi:hypothetical protein
MRTRSGRLRVAGSLFLVGAGVTALVAAQLPALPSIAVADAPPTAPGSAFASAVVLATNPEFGGLSLVVRGGQSTASYTAAQSVADSQAVNLGYIGGLLNGPPNACYGSAGGTSATAAVNALQAASSSGAVSTTADGGVEQVSANPSPETAGAITNLAPVTIPGLISLTAHSVSRVAYVAGQNQQAAATTTMGISLLGGLVTLNGLNWSASDISGTNGASTATFTMTSVTIAGKTTPIVSPSQLTSTIAAVNKVLAVLGLTLTLPAVSTDPITGTITVSPLRLEVTGTALTNTVLGSLNTTETTLEQTIGKVLDANDSACFVVIASYVGDAELIAGIVEGILAGGGFIDLDLGGASADTQAAPDFSNPLDTGALGSSTSSLSSPLASTGSSSGVTSGSFASGFGSLPSSPLAASSPTTTATTAPTSVKTEAAPAALVHCVTSSPSGRPGCWSGAATVGASALLVVGVGLFAADIVRSRRRLSRPKETL